ncbi:MAG TPA: outer membrane beta-barrel protein [Chitinophagaceae bacterium]|nr:outer membrane beta-barrel protein [Chitinophagaceae bacterium]
MKKVIILSLMIVSAFSVDAQRKRTRTATSQGNVVVRLGLGVNSTKVDPDLDQEFTSTTVHFTPSVGYMVVDNLELGVNFGVSNTNAEDVFDQAPILSKQNYKATDVNFGVYVQKYFPLNNWFAFTAAADLGLSTGSYQTDNVLGAVTTPVLAESGNRNGVGGALNFGLAFTPYNAFSFQANIAGLGVQSMKNDPDGVNNTTNTTDFGFNVHRQTMSLDFVWYFGRGLWKK